MTVIHRKNIAVRERLRPEAADDSFTAIARKEAAQIVSEGQRSARWMDRLPEEKDILGILVARTWDRVMNVTDTYRGPGRGAPGDAEKVVIALKRRAVLRGKIRHRDGFFHVPLPHWTYTVRKSPDGFSARPDGGGGNWLSSRDCAAFARRMVEFDAHLPELSALVTGIRLELSVAKMEADRNGLSRTIALITAEQLVQEHLLPLGISADCFVSEDGSTVHLLLKKVLSGMVSIPTDRLAETVRDTNAMEAALKPEMPGRAEDPQEGIGMWPGGTITIR